MKKIISILAFFLLIAANAAAANYYFNLASGDDTTGDGTAGNPWKTIDKCTTGRSAGDECRGAKTTITTLSGTLTFTNGSTSVSTSQDLTAAMAAGDVIGKNTGVDGWWMVASLTSSAITLCNQYWAPSGSGDAITAYKITPVTASEKLEINSNGSAAAYIKISGGWDLSGPTQDGITCFLGYSTGDALMIQTDNYNEICNFIIVAPSAGKSVYLYSGSYNYLHDLWLLGVSNNDQPSLDTTFGNSVYYNRFENIYITNQGNSAIKLHEMTANFNSFKNIYIYSPGNAANEYGLNLGHGSYNLFDNLRIYNAYDTSLFLSTKSTFNLFKNSILATNRSASKNSVGIAGNNNRFYNCTLTGATSYAINQSDDMGRIYDNYFIECTISGASGDYVGVTSQSDGAPVRVVIKETGSDSYIKKYTGMITMDSSAAARSGSALKFTPISASYALPYKVGSVKVPSTGSDLTISAYIKKDAGYNGDIRFYAIQNGQWLAVTMMPATTGYVKNSIVIPAADLILNNYIDLWVMVTGTAGNIWVDDFSAEQ